MEDENNLEKLQTLVEFLKATGIAEYESEQGDTKLRIKFASTSTPAAGFDAGSSHSLWQQIRRCRRRPWWRMRILSQNLPSSRRRYTW